MLALHGSGADSLGALCMTNMIMKSTRTDDIHTSCSLASVAAELHLRRALICHGEVPMRVNSDGCCAFARRSEFINR